MGKYRSSCVTSPTINIPHRMGNFFFPCHYHPKPMVYVGVQPWCRTWYGFRHMCYDVRPLYCHTECSASPQILRAPPVPPAPQPLATADLFGRCHSSAFSKVLGGWGHTVRSVLRLAVSLSNVHSRLLRVFSWLDSAFLFDAE